ncbi:hypothetical protein ACIP2Y_09330 [Streptomyces sviceus]|uniref:hypothetical protein n=1 Tax=Streptomyces sviceus TaxID=285530 RepID=UPI0037F1A2AD
MVLIASGREIRGQGIARATVTGTLTGGTAVRPCRCEREEAPEAARTAEEADDEPLDLLRRNPKVSGTKV